MKMLEYFNGLTILKSLPEIFLFEAQPFYSTSGRDSFINICATKGS